MTPRTSAPSDTEISCTATITSVSDQLIARLPADASAELPSRGQVAVTGTIDDHAFETVVEPDGRRGHWLKLANLKPKPRGPEAGQQVTITLTACSEWPEPTVPDDLQGALDAAPDLAELWETITPMARWEWVRWVRATRNPATRAKRVDVGISKMRSGKRRPCCFDLAGCTDPELSRSGKLIETED